MESKSPQFTETNVCVCVSVSAQPKMLFLLRFFVLFPAKISKKILNQEGFSRQVKMIVLFSEKSVNIKFKLKN